MSIINLENLSSDIAAKIEIYCDEMLKIHQKALISILAYGDTLAKKPFTPNTRLPLLFVFENITMETLNESLETVKKGLKNNIVVPLFMTTNNIKTSTEVFPLEFTDIKNNHILLHGKDIIQDIEIKKDNILVQCKQEIKGKIIRLRQAYLEQGGTAILTQAAILDSLNALVPAFKGLMQLKGEIPPASKEDVTEAVCTEFNLNAKIFKSIINDITRDAKIGDKKADEFLPEYVYELTKLANAVDKMDK